MDHRNLEHEEAQSVIEAVTAAEEAPSPIASTRTRPSDSCRQWREIHER
jgi:hypothetical protein